MNEEQHEALEVAVAKLEDREAAAFRKWQKSNQSPLAPDTQAKLFALFLNGKTTEEIRRLNPQFSLGQIVHARLAGNWDQLLKQHIDSLLKNTKARFDQITLEGVNFVADSLAAAHKMHGDRIARYLQTGNEEDLGTWKIDSIATYKKAVELLQMLTGVDKQQTISGQVTVTHKSDPAKVASSEEAAEVLKLLLGKKKE